MPFSPITPITEFPTRNDTRDELVRKGNIFFASVAQFILEANALAEGIGTDASVIAGAIAEATDAAAEALADRILAGEALDATQILRDQTEIFAAAAGAAIGLPSLAGNAGKALVVNPAEDGVSFGGGPNGSLEKITTSGIWVVPANVRQVKYTVIGAGGGGAGLNTEGSGSPGGSSVFDDITALGGQGGQSGGVSQSGQDARAGEVSANGGARGWGLISGTQRGGSDGMGGQIKRGLKSVSPGASLSITIGAGGAGTENAGNGGNGLVILEWFA